MIDFFKLDMSRSIPAIRKRTERQITLCCSCDGGTRNNN